jgi:hypothetical protein
MIQCMYRHALQPSQTNGHPDLVVSTIMTYIFLDDLQIRSCNHTEFHTRITAEKKCIEASYTVVVVKKHSQLFYPRANPVEPRGRIDNSRP